MEFEELFIEKYRKFEQHRMHLKTGVNVICGGNGSGKTTMSEFLETMLFGSRQEGETFRGSAVIRIQGRRYRLERSDSVQGGGCRIFDEEDHREIYDRSGFLKELAGEMTGEIYRGTLAVSGETICEQARIRAAAERCFSADSGELQMHGSGDVFMAESAIQVLEARKQIITEEKEQKKEELDRQILEREKDAGHLRKEAEILRQRMDRMFPASGTFAKGTSGGAESEGISGTTSRPVRGSLSEQTSDERSMDQDSSVSAGSGKVLSVLLVLAGILALLCCVVFRGSAGSWLFGAAGILFLVLTVPAHRLSSGEYAGDPDENGEDRESDKNGLTEEKRYRMEESDFRWDEDPELLRQSEHLQSELNRREENYRKIQSEIGKLRERRRRMDQIDTDSAALDLAVQRIRELSAHQEEAQSGSAALNREASDMLKQLTGGRIDGVQFREDGFYTAYHAGRILDPDRLGSVDRQQILFALYISAGDLSDREKQFPLILDEVFAGWDDARLEETLRWLNHCGRQVILFTSQMRTREIMRAVRQ